MSKHETFNPPQTPSLRAAAPGRLSRLRQSSANLAACLPEGGDNYAAAAVSVLLMLLAVFGILLPSLLLRDLTLTAARSDSASPSAQQTIERF
jgi:hypothetical protein